MTNEEMKIPDSYLMVCSNCRGNGLLRTTADIQAVIVVIAGWLCPTCHEPAAVQFVIKVEEL